MIENILKFLWKRDSDPFVSFAQIASLQTSSKLFLYFLLCRMRLRGLIDKKDHYYGLSEKGSLKAAKIIRLHRLWEVYLVDYLGQTAEKVHGNAEEMEHIITPELEKELTELLRDPKMDPHAQPIPNREEF